MFMANLRTKILDFGRFDSSRILILRGGMLACYGESPAESESTHLSRDTNLSRDNLSRASQGRPRTRRSAGWPPRAPAAAPAPPSPQGKIRDISQALMSLIGFSFDVETNIHNMLQGLLFQRPLRRPPKVDSNLSHPTYTWEYLVIPGHHVDE